MPEESSTPIPISAPALPFQPSHEKADMLDKIRPEEIVEIMRNRLMGKELSKKLTWETNDNLKDNAISEIGAWDLSNLMLSVVNPNVSISKLNDKEIRRRAYNIMKTAIKMTLANWNKYKITNSAQIIFASEIVFSMAFIAMKQCEGEGIRKMIIGTRAETHHIGEYGIDKGRKVFRGRKL